MFGKDNYLAIAVALADATTHQITLNIVHQLESSNPWNVPIFS